MTVSTTSVAITYDTDGSTTFWPFTFACANTGEILVTVVDADGVTTEINPTQYSVTLNSAVGPNPTPVGGSVTYPLSGDPLDAGQTITVYRELDPIQATSLANQSTLYQTVIESSLDYLTMLTQQFLDAVNRTVRGPITDPSGLTYELPSVEARAGMALGFDDDGNVQAIATLPEGTVSADMQPVINGTIANAQTLLGINAISAVPVGTEVDFAGLVAPQYWFWSRGQAVDRTDYSELMDAIAPVLQATISGGNSTVTIAARADGQQPTTGLAIGMPVEEDGVLPAGTTIQGVANTTITLSANPLSGGSSLRVFPHGAGDGATTFNLPDGKGFTYAGLDPQNGTSRLTKSTAQGVSAAGLGNEGGEQAHIQTEAEMVQHDHAITDPGHVHVNGAGTQSGNIAGGVSGYLSLGSGINTGSATTGITIDNAGSSNAANVVQPTSIRMKIIFAGAETI